MSKRTILLTILLIIQVLVIAVVYNDTATDRPNGPAGPLLAGLGPELVTGLTISAAPGPAITLARTDLGWVITSGDDYPADQARVEAFLAKIVALQSARLVTRTKASHRQLRVAAEDYDRKIELLTADNSTKTIYLGTAASYKNIHVRLAPANEVHLVKGLSAWEAPVEEDAWWQDLYIDIAPEELAAVELHNPHGTFRLQRQDRDQWLLQALTGEKVTTEQLLAEAPITDFLKQAGHISLSGYLGRQEKKEFGLDQPIARLNLQISAKGHDKDFADPLNYVTIKIGPQDEESGLHTVKATTSPFYVQTGIYAIQDLLDMKFADLAAAATDRADK